MAGIFFAKKSHQIGAVCVGEWNGVEIAILEEGAHPPGFNMTFLRYSKERESIVRHFHIHVAPASLAITGSAPTVTSMNRTPDT